MTTFFEDRRNTPMGLVPVLESTFLKNLESVLSDVTFKNCLDDAKQAVLGHTNNQADIHYNPATKRKYYTDEQLFLRDLFNEAELVEFLTENDGYFDPETHGRLMDDPKKTAVSKEYKWHTKCNI